jgi:hypothetical protein
MVNRGRGSERMGRTSHKAIMQIGRFIRHQTKVWQA